MLANSKTEISVALTVNWKITLLGLCFLPLLFRLGFWQIERAEDKQLLIDHAAKQLQLPPVKISSVTVPEVSLSGRRIIVSGEFTPQRYWLLDNRVFRGRVGYQVIAPVETKSGQVVLVNRGWVEAPPLRSDLPSVKFSSESLSIAGRWKPVENTLPEGNETQSKVWNVDWPIRIQSVNIEKMKSDLGRDLLSGYLQISPDDPQALQVLWKNINVMPEKHVGYAVQWFAMTVALAVALVFANTNLATVLRYRWKKRKQSSNNNNKGETHEFRS